MTSNGIYCSRQVNNNRCKKSMLPTALVQNKVLLIVNNTINTKRLQHYISFKSEPDFMILKKRRHNSKREEYISY